MRSWVRESYKLGLDQGVQVVASDDDLEGFLVDQIRDDQEGVVVRLYREVDERVELDQQLQERVAALDGQQPLHCVLSQAFQSERQQVLAQVEAEDELLREDLLQLRLGLAFVDHQGAEHAEVLAELYPRVFDVLLSRRLPCPARCAARRGPGFLRVRGSWRRWT